MTILASLTQTMRMVRRVSLPARDTRIVLTRPLVLATMQPKMFTTRYHLKVLRAVIRSVMVDVVNLFVPLQIAAKHTLHNESMFQDVTAGSDANEDVATRVDIPAVFPPTVARSGSTLGKTGSGTELRAADSSNEHVAALRTGMIEGHGSYDLSCRPGVSSALPGFFVRVFRVHKPNYTTERQRYELHQDGSVTLGRLGAEAMERKP